MNQIKEQSLLARMINDNPDSQFLIADGFDEAVIGYDYQTERLIYSYHKCLDILMQDEAMSYEDAVEWMGYNVMDSYMGDKTPIWCINN
jgi:hypothetical protein